MTESCKLLAKVSYGELHALGTGSPELSRNDNLATLGTRLHDEPQDTIASPSHGETVEELVAEGFALGDGGETAVLDLCGVERDGVLGELEALLDERGELTDAAALLAEDLLCVGGADDDVGNGWRDADLDAGVALLSELALEELVEFGVEDTVCKSVLVQRAFVCNLPSLGLGLSPKFQHLVNCALEAPAHSLVQRLFFPVLHRDRKRVYRTSNELPALRAVMLSVFASDSRLWAGLTSVPERWPWCRAVN